MMSDDLRRSIRVAFTYPTLSLGVLVTLAVVIGVSACLIVTTYAVVLRRLPFKDADRLVLLWESNRDTGIQHLPVTESAYPLLRRRASTFDDLAAFIPASHSPLTVTLLDKSESVSLVFATPELLSLLGASPELGRAPSAQDSAVAAEPVALLSHAFWLRRFAGRRDVLGQTLALRRVGEIERFTIIGVMPIDFTFPYPLYADKPDVWVALRLVPGRFLPGHNLNVIGALKPSIDLRTAQAELNLIAQGIARDEPRFYGAISIRAVPLRAEVVRHKGVIVAFGAAFVSIALIGSVNILHLLIARAWLRRRELAVRLAVGATKADLCRLAACEVGVLAIVGSGLGFMLAYISVSAMTVVFPPDFHIPQPEALLLDTKVVVSAGALTAVIALVLTAALWGFFRANSSMIILRTTAADWSDSRSMFKRPGRFILVCQVAFAFALTSGALAVVQHVRALLDDAAPLDPERLLVLDLAWSNDRPDTAVAELDTFVSEVRALDQVKAAALVDRFPLSERLFSVSLTPSGGPAWQTARPAEFHIVTPGYAAVVGVRLLQGRLLSDTDTRDTGPVAIINEEMARHYFPTDAPIGKRLRVAHGNGNVWPAEWEIVGVVHEPVRIGAGTEAPPAIYVPWAQAPMRNVTVLVKAANNARAIAAVVRQDALLMSLGLVEARKLQTGTDIVAGIAEDQRVLGRQLTVFAIIALLLAAVGVYSIVSLNISLRAHEMAVRAAVGGTAAGLVALVVGETMTLIAVATISGLPLALTLTYVLSAGDEHFQPADVYAYFISWLVLCCVGLVGSLPAARKAASLDPATALRM